MEELDEAFIKSNDTAALSNKALLKLIWRQPRRVFTSLALNPSFKTTVILFTISALVSGLNRSTGIWFLMTGELDYFNNFEIIKNVGLYMVIYFAMVTLIKWTGTWLGGDADWNVQASVYAYSNLPSVLALILIIPSGIYFFMSISNLFGTSHIQDSAFGIIPLVIKYAKVALAIWSLILHVISISIVQNFSILRALSNFLLAAFFLSVPLLMLSYLRVL